MNSSSNSETQTTNHSITRTVEIVNIQRAATNNLKLSRAKSLEIIFTTRHYSRVSLPLALPEIRRVTSLKIKMLGVIMTDHVSQ